jgi:hypothetical protein
LFTTIVCSIMSAGCCGLRRPDYASLGLVEVTGRVTLGGQPLAGGYVVFESSDGRQAFATTTNGGDYRLNYNSEQSGVMPGVMQVRIYSVPPAEDETVIEGGNERVPSEYNTNTKLQVTVEPGRDQTFDFDL